MRIWIIFFLLLVHEAVAAQQQKKQRYPLRVKTWGIGGRLFELNAIGNNLYTLGYLLTDPEPYLDFLDSQSFNSLYGSPGVQVVYHFHLLAEFHKENPNSRFWKKYSLQTGLFLTSKFYKD